MKRITGTIILITIFSFVITFLNTGSELKLKKRMTTKKGVLNKNKIINKKQKTKKIKSSPKAHWRSNSKALTTMERTVDKDIQDLEKLTSLINKYAGVTQVPTELEETYEKKKKLLLQNYREYMALVSTEIKTIQNDKEY